MNKDIFLSVIIPCYNAEKTICDTLNNLYSNINACDFEILVVNDGSTDASRELVIKEFGEVRSIKMLDKKNGGVSDARNFGLKHASGKYVWFFDADDFCFDGSIDELIKVLYEREPDVLSFGCVTVDVKTSKRLHDFGNAGKSKIVFDGIYSEYLKYNRLNETVFSLIVRKDCLLDNGILLNTSLSIMEDGLWNIELALANPNLRFVRTNLMVVKYMVWPWSAMNSCKVGTNRKHLDSLIAVFDKIDAIIKTAPSFLVPHLIRKRNSACRLMVTRFLSCKTSRKESNEYLSAIRCRVTTNSISMGRQIDIVLNLMSNYLSLVPILQFMYRNVFIRYFKRFVPRN